MNILLVDDDYHSRIAIKSFLIEQLNYLVIDFDNGKKAFESFLNNDFDVVLTDIKMPSDSGINLLENIKNTEKGAYTDVILFTGYASTDTAIRAIKAGAIDYLLKPVNRNELVKILRIIEKKNDKKDTIEKLPDVKNEPEIINHIHKVKDIGDVGVFSITIKSVMDTCLKLHKNRSLPVLIEGETGVGKEIIARTIHHGGKTSESPFISINCSAIAATLFESELFGYEEGAFTGAKKRGHMGKLELASGGTIFLDEIGDMPLELQPKLLRAIQYQEIYRVGGNQLIKLNVRFICASNQNITDMMNRGLFRSDLYYRLSASKVFVPPLRERKKEIVPLAQMFLDKFTSESDKQFKYFTKDSMTLLESYQWKGNIRELENTIERVVLMYDDIEVKAEYLNFLDVGHIERNPIQHGKIELPNTPLNLDMLILEIVDKALKKHNGNKTKTAEYLGITRSALRSRMK